MNEWWKITVADTTAVQLVVAHRTGKHGIASGAISISRDIADELRGIVTDTIERMNEQLTGRQWSPEVGWEDDEFQIVARDRLEPDNPLLEAMETEIFADLAAAELRDLSLLLYAIVVGTGPDRLLFVRKTNPQYSAETRLLAILGPNHLDRVRQPLFSFDRRCDMILIPRHGLVAFSENVFDQLFRDSPDLQESVTAAASTLAPNLLAGESGEVLAAAATKYARLRRKIMAINARAHLGDVTVEQLEAEFARLGFDPAVYMPGGKLTVTTDNVHDVVRVLNEDLFQGGLSRHRFEAERKRLR